MRPPPLSLYVHLPWCVRKCPYCDFNSYTAGPAAPRSRYLDALLLDLRLEAERAARRPLISVFLGGGTPSLFTPAEIARLLDAVSECFVASDDIEVTMEANPGTVECGDPRGYRAAGVNRLSIGAQSFDDDALRGLGRVHSADDVVRAAAGARSAGFDNVNLDLMYGLPGQRTAAALRDIDTAASLEPQHISWYQLTLEPNTVFHSRPPPGMPCNERCFEMQQRGQARLREHGYEQYEVSAYARDGYRCRHNMNYWSFGDYLAAGAGAHGKISGAGGVYRYAKPANPLQYMRSIEERRETSDLPQTAEADLVFEFMLNVSRLTDGFDERLFASRTGLPVDALRQRLRPAVERGLIARRGVSAWQPTAMGRRFLNDLQAEFLPD